MTSPAGAGNTLRQIKLIKDFRTTVIHIIPSYALVLANVLSENGEDPSALPPRIALIGAEPHSEQTRRRVEKALGVNAYNSYGLSEMNGPGVAFECREQNGLHVWEDAYIVEIVNPETGEYVAEGETGELVLTTLCRVGMPILRYRTRDLTRFISGDCACGRVHRRIDRIHGRTDDMFIIKGVNIYPIQIEQVIMARPEVGQNYLIVLENAGPKEDLKVKVEIRDEYFVEDMRTLQSLQQKIARHLQNEILVTPKVELVQSNSLPTSDGKAKRVLDLRDK
jgi:phenylacetate-CoA ligase